LSIGWISIVVLASLANLHRHEVFIEVADIQTGQRNSQPQIPLLRVNYRVLRITAFFEYPPSTITVLGLMCEDNSSSQELSE